MLIKQISLFTGMSGKLNKKHNVVFYNKNGKVFAWENNSYRGPWTEKQAKVHQAFKAAWQEVAQEFTDPTNVATWELAAKASNGKYKSARSAAFASFFATKLAELNNTNPTA